MSRTLISIRGGVARHPDYRLAAPLNFSLHEGEHLAVCGPNGAGKSLLTDMLTSAHPLLGDALRYDFGEGETDRAGGHIRLITFRTVYGGSEPAYYQQRWNRADEQVFPTVGEVLQAARTQLHAAPSAEEDKLLRETGITEHLEKPVNLLSSGELRRLQLSKMLLTHPQVLIIDNPYIGLDGAARTMLTRLLTQLAARLTLILVVSRAEDIPPFIKEVLPVENKVAGEKQPLADFLRSHPRPHFPEPAEKSQAPKPADAPPVIDFRHITIRYGARTILRDLSWEVRQGESWALTGENGAGKSTLLSLVCADNPQGYACDIRLFGQRRGTGESIWDIKRRIGYVSPEIFSTYRKPLPALDIVASGLHDTIGLYKRPTEAERQTCLAWLRRFGAEHLAERDYLRLSSGEQRLVLLVRAFAKSPDLLILDEPFHGLDTRLRETARGIINDYMASPLKTLIMVTHYEDELPPCIDHRLRLVKQV